MTDLEHEIEDKNLIIARLKAEVVHLANENMYLCMKPIMYMPTTVVEYAKYLQLALDQLTMTLEEISKRADQPLNWLQDILAVNSWPDDVKAILKRRHVLVRDFQK